MVVSRRDVSTGLLVLLFGLMFVIGGLSVWFVEDRFERAALVLVSSFAAVAAILGVGVALTAYRRGEPWAWWAMWSVPAFFVFHAALLRTWVPDGPLAVVAVVALLLHLPRRRGATP